jgi:transcriptional regulator with XRE-family HTH domain
MDNYSDFVGTNVRKLRDRMGMTQEELAELSGLSREEISRIENGRKKIISKSLRKIAEATRIDVRQLMAGLDPETRSSLGEGGEKYEGEDTGNATEELLRIIGRAQEILLNMARGSQAEK